MLIKHGGNPDLVRWYHNLLQERRLRMTLQEEELELYTGVGFPQGGVASAKFWLIAFDMAIRIINKNLIEGNGYADDCSALIGGNNGNNMVRRMQRTLDQLTSWGKTCGLRFNPEKTVVVFFSRSKKTPTLHLKMDGKVLPYTDSAVYLGVTLDRKMHWQTHINNKLQKAKRRLMQISNTTRHTWGPRPKLMKWSYTGVTRTVMGYGAYVWAHDIDYPGTRKKLDRLNRMALCSFTKFKRSVPTLSLIHI